MYITVHAPIIQELAQWVEDQTNNLDTHEVRLNFATQDLKLYDYESDIITSRRPLSYFI